MRLFRGLSEEREERRERGVSGENMSETGQWLWGGERERKAWGGGKEHCKHFGPWSGLINGFTF